MLPLTLGLTTYNQKRGIQFPLVYISSEMHYSEHSNMRWCTVLHRGLYDHKPYNSLIQCADTPQLTKAYNCAFSKKKKKELLQMIKTVDQGITYSNFTPSHYNAMLDSYFSGRLVTLLNEKHMTIVHY